MINRTLNLLLIAVADIDFETVRKELYLSTYFDFSLEWRRDVSAALQATAHTMYDGVLFNLPALDETDFTLFRKMRAQNPDLPIIVLTESNDEARASAVIDLGAQDCLPKHGPSGTLPRIVALAIQRYETVHQLILSERKTRSSSLAKSAFFASMSHEIRNPLTAIVGYSEALLGSKMTAQDTDNALSAIFSNGRHLLQVINDILDLSKIEAGELRIEPTQEWLAPLLRDLLQTFGGRAAQKKLAYSIEVELPFPAKLETDFFRLKQILYNLIGNAMKFTAEGFVKILVESDVATNTLSFHIKDSGVGISEEGTKKLFQAFSQGDPGRARQYGGSGLGLVISGQLANKLGGTIELRSRQGIGSVFTLKLPLGEVGVQSMREDMPTLEANDEDRLIDGTTIIQGTVLVADDLEDNRNLLSLLLRKVGLEVVLAEDGAQALRHAHDIHFDLVLLDMQMPLVDGKQVAAELRSRGSTVPIVAITANMLEDALDECLEAGCDACLPKPFRQEELFECILKFLSKNAKRSENVARPTVQVDELAEVRKSFLKKLPQRIGLIEEALQSGDLEKLKMEAHRIVGAGLFGYQELSHLGGTLESLVIQEQKGGLGLVEALVKKVRSEFGKLALMEQSSEHHGDKPESANRLAMVLVADDDEVNLKVVCRVLNVKGFVAAPARTVEDAVKMCSEHSFSFVMIALEMGAERGIEIIRAARSKNKENMPVIAMTTHMPVDARAFLKGIEVNALITKPISRDQVFEGIDTLISESLSE